MKQPRRRDPRLLALLKYQSAECEVLGTTTGLHLHHVLFRSHGGDDVRANIVCLDDELHESYHRGDPVAKRLLADYIRSKRPDTVIYLAEKLGEDGCAVWFERHGSFL